MQSIISDTPWPVLSACTSATSLRAHIAHSKRIPRFRQPDPAVSNIVYRVEALQPRHSIDKIEPRPGDRAIVRHDQVVPIGVTPNVCIELDNLRQQV